MAAEDIFAIRFTKQFVWGLLHGDRGLMQVHYRRPELPATSFPEEQFRSTLCRVFATLTPGGMDRLSQLALTIAGQKHGCMLVISSAAAHEAVRLASQATCVEPFTLTETVTPLVTSIDGAVLIDTAGTCHAIGVILDGMASEKCSPERGARYNSAVRYVYGRKVTFGQMDAVAVVKSEDGMVSVFPQLRPQIRRSEKEGRLRTMRSISTTLPIDADGLWDLMTWFHNHRFYLTAQECDEIERLNEEAMKRRPVGTPDIRHGGKLEPHPDLDDSYFLPE